LWFSDVKLMQVRILSVLLCCSLSFVEAGEATLLVSNNPNLMINTNTYQLSTSLSALIGPSLNVRMNHRFQRMGGEQTEFSEIDIAGGNLGNFSYRLSRGFGQSSLYFANSSFAFQAMKRLPNTALSGFYAYRQDGYLFGIHRQIELGSDMSWNGTSFNMGGRMETIGQYAALQYFFFARRDLKYVEGNVQAKIYVGPQTLVDDMSINTPELGLKINIAGQWLFLGMPANLHFRYGVSGLLIKRVTGVYRRFGAEFGLVYLY